MLKVTMQIEGMQCGMCEAHINTTIRNAFPVKKVSSSHVDGQTVILTEKPVDEQKLKEAIRETGYTVVSFKTEPFVKKRFSLFKR